MGLMVVEDQGLIHSAYTGSDGPARPWLWTYDELRNTININPRGRNVRPEVIPDLGINTRSGGIERYLIGFWAISEMRSNSAEGLNKKKVIVKQSWNRKYAFSADSGYVSNFS
ncbi:hypothetical protein BHYA_0059g00160 [Botrytis hyacinthi]|uniref:Uncharacterized protein n=1 Tax=Botrytis hyacinthi TaxID=278943 RepID=A0A4Z1GV11_9HELO|nr:hypothetical protein BHYA_0059g00160 [Botrytis hyacinthi]